MSQLSASAARVIDPILSTVAQGYSNNAFVGGALFPNVAVPQRAGKVIQFGKESFLAYDTARAPGAAIKRISIGFSNQSYAIEDHALAGIVPRELQEEAEAVPGINLASGTVRTVMDALRLRLEVAQATLATTAGNYNASNKVTLSGTSQWSDLTTGVSDPINTIETAKEAIRAATGKRPNVVVMGAAVLKSLRQHPKIIDRIVYTGRDVPSLELLAALWGVDTVLVGDAIQATDAGVFSDVWGKSVVVAYCVPSAISDPGLPTFGYTYQLSGYPFVEPPRYDADIRSWIYDVADAVKPVIAAQDAGYLISAAVA